jgi:hypothetical protein
MNALQRAPPSGARFVLHIRPDHVRPAVCFALIGSAKHRPMLRSASMRREAKTRPLARWFSSPGHSPKGQQIFSTQNNLRGL